MKQSQLNRIQHVIDGIRQARAELARPDRVEHICEVLRENLFTESDTLMTTHRAAYLACMVLAWQEAGSPDLEG